MKEIHKEGDIRNIILIEVNWRNRLKEIEKVHITLHKEGNIFIEGDISI